jgi:hypothetical protein
MAVAPQTAEGVEKPSRRAKRTATKDTVSGAPPVEPQAPWRRWLALGLPVAAALAGAAALYVVWERPWPARDPASSEMAVQRRWNKLLESANAESSCYAHLVSPPRPGQCAHSAKSSIRPKMYDWVKPHVSVYTTPAAPPPSKTLRDLGDAAQAQAIALLAQDKDLKGGALAVLQGALNAPDADVGERDPFTFDRVLIANVAKGTDWMPGDRMQWTRVLIQPINFKFAGYSVADTDNETQKVSSVEATASRKVSPAFSATIPGVEGPKLSLEASSERDVKASADVSAQYQKLGIDIMPSFLRIVREAEKGVDIALNTRVPLTLATDPQMIRKQTPGDKRTPEHQAGDDAIVLLVTRFEGDGVDRQQNGADKQASGADGHSNPIEILPQAPVPHCPLLARVWMIYEERRIEGARENYDEGSQDVTLRRDAEDKQDVEVLSADEVSPAVWSLKLCQDARCDGQDTYLLRARPRSPDGIQNTSPWRKVVFKDYGLATRVEHWLRLKHTSMPANSVYDFNFPFDAGRRYVGMAPVKAKDDDCAANNGHGEPPSSGLDATRRIQTARRAR